MDSKESKKLDEIHSDVRETHTKVRVVNQKISNVEDKLESVEEDAGGNRQDIDELQGKVKRNSTVLTGITGGASVILLWLSDKITRIL